MRIFLEKHYKVIIGAILTFMAVVSVLNAWWDTATFDERAHIPAGYSYLKYHDMRLNPEHPPLIKDLAGFPLTLMNLNFGTDKDFWTKDINGQWDAGTDLMWQEGNNSDWLIFWSRIPIVIISLVLGFFIFKWIRELAGIAAGLFGLALYAFDPNVLGHNHFVTTDLGIAAFMVFSFYYFIKFIKEPNWKNVFVGGFFLGLVQLAKFSSIMLFPIFGLALFFYPFVKIKRDKKENKWLFLTKKVLEYLGKGAAAFAFSLIVVWGVYYFNTYEMPKQKLAETIDFYFHPDETDNVKNIYTNKALHTLNSNDITRPLSAYGLGTAMVFKRVAGGNGAYFMGQVSSNAFAAYFPTVFLLKEPPANLFFMLLAVIIGFSVNIKAVISAFRNNAEGKMRHLAHYLRIHVTSLSMIAFIVLYSYISITGNLNIGFRHLFPILPFVYILTAVTIFKFLKHLGEKQNKLILGTVISVFTLFLVADTVSAYPYYLSYFNSFAGGPKNGYAYVTDSNADWGQDLKRLRAFIKEYNKCDLEPSFARSSVCEAYNSRKIPIDKIRVDYFGGADISHYIGGKYVMWWDSKRPVEPGWYAVSANFLQGSLYDKTKTDEESYRWIRDLNLKPVYQVGTSILIYYVTPEQAEAAK